MIYVFIALFLVLHSLEVLGTANVGTVLFTKTDLSNATWSADDVALLRARLYFQHLLPPIITPQTPNYVETLLKYFKNGYLAISREAADEKTDKILTMAFTDVIGGYMKMYALPIAKYAYYGGTLSTADTLKLFLFYEDLKNYLGKDGSTWSSPDYARLEGVTINVALPQMLVRSMVKQDPCLYLSYFEKTSQGLSLPTPKIDWATRTMFVPLANQSLVDLRSTNMTYPLLKYYHAASNCLLSARPNKLDNFNHRFQLWLQEDVMPHLNDDRLYAPLQGVLSLINNTYDAEAYQNLMLHYGTADVRCSHGEHSKKIKIIIAIVLFEIFCCVPTVVYVFFGKKKSGSNGSSSSVNVVFETRTDRSFSDYDLRLSKSSPVKRHGGLKWRQKPMAMMESGEGTSRSHHSMGTGMTSGPAPEHEDMATMVDEFLDHRRRKSCKDVQKLPHIASSANAVTGAPETNETSDDTGKTVTLSSTTGPSKTTPCPSKTMTGPSKPTTCPCKTATGPSKATSCPSKMTTVKLERQATAGTSTEVKPSESPRRCSVDKYSKRDSKEFVKMKNSGAAKTADYLKSQLFKETALLQMSKEHVPFKKIARKNANEERKVRKKSKTFKMHAEDESTMKQGGNNPYVEIGINTPQLEVFSVDVTREEKRFKKSGSPTTSRASRIPKRALGDHLQVDKYKQPLESTSRDRKSMIPILRRTLDDSYLKTSIDCKVDKLNDTL